MISAPPPPHGHINSENKPYKSSVNGLHHPSGEIPHLSEPHLSNDNLEAVWIEISRTKSKKPILISTSYRPPDQRNFVETPESVCAILPSTILLNILKIFGLTQLINEPTRINEQSQTAILW